MPAPVFLRNRVPGLGLMEVLTDGTVRLDGDIEVSPTEWRKTTTAVVDAYACSQQAAATYRPLSRKPDATEQLEKLADL